MLELSCGRGVDILWLAQHGYRVTACDVSETALRDAKHRARSHGVQIAFHIVDALQDASMLPRCDAVFERGLLHTFVDDEGRSLLARVIADCLNPGQLWLSIAGAAAIREEARNAATHLSQASASVRADGA